MYTDPLERVHTRVVLSRLKVLGEKAIWYRSEFLIAWVSLALIPGVSHFRNAKPLFL